MLKKLRRKKPPKRKVPEGQRHFSSWLDKFAQRAYMRFEESGQTGLRQSFFFQRVLMIIYLI
jgi:hypothetical protein